MIAEYDVALDNEYSLVDLIRFIESLGASYEDYICNIT